MLVVRRRLASLKYIQDTSISITGTMNVMSHVLYGTNLDGEHYNKYLGQREYMYVHNVNEELLLSVRFNR